MTVRQQMRGRGEQGDVAPQVILTPITVFLVLFVVQIGLAFHARTVVTAAAQDGARAVQVEGGTEADGRATINAVLSGSEKLLRNPTVEVSQTLEEVTVTVTAVVPSVVPFWTGTVTGTAVGPTERFRPQNER